MLSSKEMAKNFVEVSGFIPAGCEAEDTELYEDVLLLIGRARKTEMERCVEHLRFHLPLSAILDSVIASLTKDSD